MCDTRAQQRYLQFGSQGTQSRCGLFRLSATTCRLLMPQEMSSSSLQKATAMSLHSHICPSPQITPPDAHSFEERVGNWSCSNLEQKDPPKRKQGMASNTTAVAPDPGLRVWLSFSLPHSLLRRPVVLAAAGGNESRTKPWVRLPNPCAFIHSGAKQV